MPLLLPNLDDRTWADLVAESTALIPVYGPEWTDQNYSDPGITIVELLAWIAEMDIYRLNQITDQQRRKFLALIGVVPAPARPAHVILDFALNSGASVVIPADVEFFAHDASGNWQRFRALHDCTLAPGDLTTLQYKDSLGFHDLTPAWLRGRPLAPFGSAPQPGNEFYLGFSSGFPVGQAVQVYFSFADASSSHAERLRLIHQAKENALRCNPPPGACRPSCCSGSPTDAGQAPTAQKAEESPAAVLQHYGVRTSWEYLGTPLGTSGGTATWIALDAGTKQVVDETRAFSLDGKVTFTLPGAMTSAALGPVPGSYFYLRCRFLAGSYDAAPSLLYPALNGAVCVQSVPAAMPFVISVGASQTYASGVAPKPGEKAALTISFDDARNITALRVNAPAENVPAFTVLQFEPATPTAKGCLALDAEFLGVSDGTPFQQFQVGHFPIEPATFCLSTFENGAWQRWELCTDFGASSRFANDAVLHASTGVLVFGDGEHGRVPAPSAQVFAHYQFTSGIGGNLPAGNLKWSLADSFHNRAVLDGSTPGGWAKLQSAIRSISNPLAADGGAAEETIDLAAGRADSLVTTTDRAVTLADYERLALRTPGARIARVAAIANLHPSFPCFKAPGLVTVCVLPYLPAQSPTPSVGLLNAVRAYLQPRRVIGTRVEVAGPTYLDVTVQATIQSEAHSNKSALQQAVIKAINNFLDPLKGGPEGTGWPFGRSVYRSEIMKIIAGVPGVDYVQSLAFLSDDGTPQCGNVCLGPTWLVKPGAHQISVS